MNHNEMIALTKAEANAVYELISELSGCSPENVFAWDGTDNINNATIAAAAKIFKAAGAGIPDNLKLERGSVLMAGDDRQFLTQEEVDRLKWTLANYEEHEHCHQINYELCNIWAARVLKTRPQTKFTQEGVKRMQERNIALGRVIGEEND